LIALTNWGIARYSNSALIRGIIERSLRESSVVSAQLMACRLASNLLRGTGTARNLLQGELADLLVDLLHRCHNVMGLSRSSSALAYNLSLFMFKFDSNPDVSASLLTAVTHLLQDRSAPEPERDYRYLMSLPCLLFNNAENISLAKLLELPQALAQLKPTADAKSKEAIECTLNILA
jgi:hypothetical protein